MTGSDSPASAPGPGHRRGAVRRAVHRLRRHPAGNAAVRIGVGVAGGIVVLVGIVLVPFPGPGWAVIFAGLGIWAIEFHWARRLLRLGRREVGRWTRWYRRQRLAVRLLTGTGTVLLVAAVVVGATWWSVGPQLRDWLAAHGWG